MINSNKFSVLLSLIILLSIATLCYSQMPNSLANISIGDSWVSVKEIIPSNYRVDSYDKDRKKCGDYSVSFNWQAGRITIDIDNSIVESIEYKIPYPEGGVDKIVLRDKFIQKYRNPKREVYWGYGSRKTKDLNEAQSIALYYDKGSVGIFRDYYSVSLKDIEFSLKNSKATYDCLEKLKRKKEDSITIP